MSELKKFGELQPGDWVEGPDGLPVQVAEAYEKHTPEEMWEIELDNGVVIKASGNHLWYCETIFDLEHHNARKSAAKKILKKLTPEVIALLEETAAKPEIVEASLADMALLLQTATYPERAALVERVAESIGPIAEQTETFEFYDGGEEDTVDHVIHFFDAALFAQQILALTGRRKYRKVKIIVGRVLKTTAMMELMDTVDIPVSRPLNSTVA